MKLSELFQKGGKSVRPWELEYGDALEYLYTFDFGKDESFYDVTLGKMGGEDPRLKRFDKVDKNIDPWEVVFAYHSPDGKEHDGIVSAGGNAIKIFATIIDIIRSFIQKEHPDGFIFSGREKSRQKLYDRFAEMLAKQIGGKVHTIIQSHGKEYLIVK